MLASLPVDLLVLIGLVLIFDFFMGFHGSSAIVATMISSRAMGPRRALLIAACGEALGPFLFGVAVARTIGGDVIAEVAVTLPVLIAATGGALGWSLITWRLGIPSSASHALIGGMAGAALSGFGAGAVQWAGLGKVIQALVLAPPLGLALGYLAMKAILFLARGATPRINTFFKRGQVVTALVLSLAQGANDAQKVMGLVALGLVTSSVLPVFDVPAWVIAASAGAMALGTSLGGWRLIRTLGARFYTIRPVHGFTAQVASTAVILGASLIGQPVSTAQVVSSSVLGVGSAERLSKVRWSVARTIAVAWLLTIPMSALLAGGIYQLIR
jgi:PiT family inorganic phosphate transporter